MQPLNYVLAQLEFIELTNDLGANSDQIRNNCEIVGMKTR